MPRISNSTLQAIGRRLREIPRPSRSRPGGAPHFGENGFWAQITAVAEDGAHSWKMVYPAADAGTFEDWTPEIAGEENAYLPNGGTAAVDDVVWLRLANQDGEGAPWFLIFVPAPSVVLTRIAGAGDADGDYLGVQLNADLTTSTATPFDGEEGNRPQLREVNRLKGVFATGEVVEAWRGMTDDEEPTPVWYVKSPVGYGQAFTVKLTNVTGNAGDDENDCTFTYDVEDLDGNQLLEAATPERKRYPKIAYAPASEDSFGLACYRIGEGGTPGALVLLDAIEEIALLCDEDE